MKREHPKKRHESAFIPVSLECENSKVFVHTSTTEITIQTTKITTVTTSDSDRFAEFCKTLRKRQNDIPRPNLCIATPIMRTQFIDWLFQVCEFLKLGQKVAFQALSLIDSYTSRYTITSEELGDGFVSSLLIVIANNGFSDAKVHEVEKFCYEKCNRESVSKMVSRLVDALDHKVNPPTCIDFLEALFHAAHYQKSHPLIKISMQFLSVMAFDNKFATSLPSSVAAAAFYLARDFCHYKNLWVCSLLKLLI